MTTPYLEAAGQRPRSAAAPDATVLAIQSEPETRSVLEHGLSCLGLVVHAVSDVGQGIAGARSGDYELVLLDLVLPDRDGFALLIEMHGACPHLPVIVLTALGGVENRVRALEAGAVDYVVKPFSLRELAARIRAQVRQAQSSQTTHLSGAGIDVDLLNRKVCHHGVPIRLSTLEFRLLVFLMQHPGIIHTRRDILNAVWDQDSDAGNNLVDVYVGYLRRKLREQDPHAASAIQTVRTRGYRFDAVEGTCSRGEVSRPQRPQTRLSKLGVERVDHSVDSLEQEVHIVRGDRERRREDEDISTLTEESLALQQGL